MTVVITLYRHQIRISLNFTCPKIILFFSNLLEIKKKNILSLWVVQKQARFGRDLSLPTLFLELLLRQSV